MSQRIDQAVQLLKQKKQQGREIIMERIAGRVLLSDTYFIINKAGDDIDDKQWGQLMELFIDCAPGEAVRVYKDHTKRQQAFISDYYDKFKAEATAQVLGYEAAGQTGQHINKQTGHTVTEYQVIDQYGGMVYIDMIYAPLLSLTIRTKPGKWQSVGGALSDHYTKRDQLSVRRSPLYSDIDGQGGGVVVLPLKYDPKEQGHLERVSNYELFQAVQEYGPVMFTVKGQDPSGRRWTRCINDPWNLSPNRATIYAPDSAIHAAGLTSSPPAEPDKLRRVARVVAGVLLPGPKYYDLIKYQAQTATRTKADQDQEAARLAHFNNEHTAPHAQALRDELQARGLDSGRFIVGTIKGAN